MLDDYPFLTSEDIFAALQYALALVEAENTPEERAVSPSSTLTA